MFLWQWIGCAVVGAVWGITNPFVKSGLELGAERSTHASPFVPSPWVLRLLPRLFQNLYLLLGDFLVVFLLPYLGNSRFITAFIANQLGGLLYLWILGQTNFTVSGPVCGAVSLVTTFSTEVIFFQMPLQRREILALGFIFAGLCLALS